MATSWSGIENVRRPTPFALTGGTTGLTTLIVPEHLDAPAGFREVGRLSRTEAAELVVAYQFDLRSNELRVERAPNPHAGVEHRFVAYRLAAHNPKPVSISQRGAEAGS